MYAIVSCNTCVYRWIITIIIIGTTGQDLFVLCVKGKHPRASLRCPVGKRVKYPGENHCPIYTLVVYSAVVVFTPHKYNFPELPALTPPRAYYIYINVVYKGGREIFFLAVRRRCKYINMIQMVYRFYTPPRRISSNVDDYYST